MEEAKSRGGLFVLVLKARKTKLFWATRTKNNSDRECDEMVKLRQQLQFEGTSIIK